MSTPPRSASGSGIVVQAPIHVPLPTYDWNAWHQMWESWLFKHEFTSWKKICQIMSNEVNYLLSILGKEGYAAIDCWMPTDPADIYDAWKFLNYLESILDDEISPCVKVYELEDAKKRTDETIDALIDCICQLACCAVIGDGSDTVVEFEVQCRLICAIPDGDIELWKELLQVSWDKGVSHLWEICHTFIAIQSRAAAMCAGETIQCSTDVPSTSNATTEASLTVQELLVPAPTWVWQLSCCRVCMQRLFEERTLVSQVSFQQEKPIHCSSGQPIKRYTWSVWKEGEEGWPHRSPHWGTTCDEIFLDDVNASHTMRHTHCSPTCFC